MSGLKDLSGVRYLLMSHLFLKHDCMQAKQLIQRDALGRSSGLLSANPRLLVRGLHHEPRTLDPFSAET